jgi:hypothetical protein
MLPVLKRKVVCGMAAGAVGATVNTLLLLSAKSLGINTGNGALIQLLRVCFSWSLRVLGLAALWNTVHLPAPGSQVFRLSFHIGTGLAMALFYALVVDKAFRVRPWIKGSLYAAAVWLINAAVVLPLAGAGLGGWHRLSLGGIAYFAFAHAAFFFLLISLYEFCCARAPRSTDSPADNRAEAQ